MVIAAQSDFAEAWHYLGVIAYQAGRVGLAIELIQRAISLNPANADAHSNLGEVFRSLGRLDEAVASHRRALEFAPRSAEIHNNLGHALDAKGQTDEALAAYRLAIRLRPDFAMAHNNLGVLLANCGAMGEAIAAYHRALELAPGCVEFHHNLGNVLLGASRLDEATRAYDHSLALNPQFADGHLNLGVIAWQRGRFAEAEERFRRALACRADFADAHVNLGLLLLLLGRYEEGWREYDWRWRSSEQPVPSRQGSTPRWEEQSAPGKTVLVHAEQGYGDVLLFTRYLPLLRSLFQATHIVLKCQPELVPLLAQLAGRDFAVAPRGEPEDSHGFDYQLSLLSLPLALQCFSPVPPITPPLQADPATREKWRGRLGTDLELRVGLAWAGSPAQHGDRHRSIAPEEFSELVREPGIRFVSLQIQPRDPLPPVFAEAGVIDITTEVHNFADSAALIAELDLVITVDTAMAHLAGTLGWPVWVLTPFVPYWPYGLNGESTPWYPTMRMFRQSCSGGWKDVMEAATFALREWRSAQTVR